MNCSRTIHAIPNPPIPVCRPDIRQGTDVPLRRAGLEPGPEVRSLPLGVSVPEDLGDEPFDFQAGNELGIMRQVGSPWDESQHADGLAQTMAMKKGSVGVDEWQGILHCSRRREKE